jgi:TolB-like protein
MQTQNKKMRVLASIFFLFVTTFFCQPGPAGAASMVITDKDVYGSGEMIRVNFSNAPGNNSDWIAIVPAGSPDTEAGDYQYMPKGLSEGSLTYTSPPPGKYEVRAYYNYRRNGYVVSARHGFSVGGGVSAVESGMALAARPRAGAEIIKKVESKPAADTYREPPRLSASVFYFTPLSMDVSNYGLTVTNTLINAPKMQSSLILLNRKDLETFLSVNDLQQNDQVENMVNIGSRMGLNYVIAGSIGKRGTMIVTTCKVVSIEQKKVVFTNQSMSTGEADLINNTMKLADAIIEAIHR